MIESNQNPSSLLLFIAVAAGDGEALKTLLGGLRTGEGLCVLLAAADQDGVAACSAALEATSTGLPAVDAVDGLDIQPDRIYRLPLDSYLQIVEGRLQLLHAAPENDHADAALMAVAEGHGDGCVAVFLQGAAHFAGAGAQAVIEAGGTVLFQDARPAHLTGGAAEAQPFPAAQLAGQVLALAERRRASAPPQISQDELARILAVVGAETGVDFSDYKKTTLRRRIQRRMGMGQITTAAAYVELLESSSGEGAILHREMLIGVTRFFRDPEAFATLTAKVIAPLFAKPGREEPVRIWVAGCATGEEAYSIGILVREAMGEDGRQVAVKIFATDLDREAIETASLGLFPASIAEDVSPARLARFFTRRGDHWQIAKQVRELVVFAHHNVTRDPPFFRMDLVTCRNLLIYLEPALQRRVFNAFHFALGADGHLMLGTSETLGEMAQFFTAVDPRWKIFRKRGERAPRMSDSIFPDRLGQRARPAPLPENPQLPSESLQEAIQQTMLTELVPAFLVADANFDIHYTSGAVSRYLALPRGKPSLNLIRMAPRELAVALSTGIRRALREGRPVVFDEIELRHPTGSTDGHGRVRLSIRPLPHRQDLGELVAVIFEEPGSPPRVDGQAFDLAEQTDQRIEDLETELEHSRESLQAAIEELETSNEELQATNEEVLAANEELQSTNEELQSVNEELYTVNAENQAKILELTELNDDILNLLGSSNIGTVFLDRRLCVRKFTRSATAQINLIEKDIGRPLAHISNNIEQTDLVADAAEVLRTLVPKQRKVCTREGLWHLMRILPYRTEDNVIKGVVITFIDIAEIIIAGEQVRALANTIDSTAALVLITAPDGSVSYVNQRFAEVAGWSVDEIIGRDPRFLLQVGQEAALADLERSIAAGTIWTGRLRRLRRDGRPFIEEVAVVPLRDQLGRTTSRMMIGNIVAEGSQ
jgi:two-component system CheB/CheR fusion protein